MKKTLVPLTILLATMLNGCSDNTPSFDVNKISVSDFTYTMNKQPAVVITFQQDDNNYCEITLYRKDINAGFSTHSEKKSNDNISSSCNINNATYIQSSKQNTMSSVHIESLNIKEKNAFIDIRLKLVNVKKLDSHFKINNKLKISGLNFDYLTMN